MDTERPNRPRDIEERLDSAENTQIETFEKRSVLFKIKA